MNPNSISHRLFVAALKPNDQASGYRPSAVRSAGDNAASKTNATKSKSSFSALASRRVAAWSWSGWQQNAV